MGTAAYRGKGFKGSAAVSGERPIGAAGCRQQHTRRPPPPFQGASGICWTDGTMCAAAPPRDT